MGEGTGSPWGVRRKCGATQTKMWNGAGTGGGDRSRLVETTRTGTGDAGSPLGQPGPHVATRKELPWNTAVSGKGRPGSGSSITEREPAPVECAPRILAERGATSQ
jgi:hypothetical protein